MAISVAIMAPTQTSPPGNDCLCQPGDIQPIVRLLPNRAAPRRAGRRASGAGSELIGQFHTVGARFAKVTDRPQAERNGAHAIVLIREVLAPGGNL